MDHTNLPTKTGWFSVELPGYRPGQGTYDFSAYDSLPPLPTELFTGKLEWLKTSIEDKTPKNVQTRMQKLSAQAQQLGLVLPEAFLRLMGSPKLQESIPSCTACEFQPVETILPHPGIEHGYIIRFLNDQQDVLLWYLYLNTAGEHCVLVSGVLLEELNNPKYVDNPALWDSAAIAKSTLVCALSFEEFIYRFWLENTLWFKLNDHKDLTALTADEQRYLSHYQSKAESTGHTPTEYL
jgi:hypothetical protein